LLGSKNRRFVGDVSEGRMLPTVNEFYQMTMTFTMAVIGWVFFRSESLKDAFLYLKGIFWKGTDLPEHLPIEPMVPLLVTLFIILEWIFRHKDFVLENLESYIPNKPMRWLSYVSLVIMILFLSGEQQEFIYFQF
jgi:alginate O-acetyltransferase complex protein AlgI